MIRASLIRLSPFLALAAVLAALLVLAGPPLGATPVAAGSDSCVTTDTDLVSQVEAKVERHTNETDREDLKEMFSRSLATMKGTDDYTTADIKARPDKQGDNWQGAGPNPLWQKIYSELDRLETCRGAQSDDNTPATPAVSVAAGSGITEGGTATFTVSASPAPTADLAVSVTVTQSGDYAASGTTGSKSVTIPTSGSATYSVATVDDAADEADGSVTVAIGTGNGYSVGSSSTATVSVADDDVPEIGIAAGSGITEGGSAVFTLSASPAPHAALAVSLTVSQGGDYAASGTTGTKSVTIPTSGSATYSVATVDDSADEADGSVSVAIGSGNGYSVGSSSTATVSVADNDDPPAQTPVVSIAAGSGITEGGNASFTITASPSPTADLSVSLTVSQGGDYAASGSTGTKTVSIPTTGSATYTVATVDDATDEADGSVTVAIGGGNGYTVGSTSTATVNVSDNDDPPAAIPTVSIAAGSGVTEGGAATFTVTASPAPAAPLSVSLTVSQSGDYAASGTTGTKSVTVPTSGSAQYSVATVDDTTDEADGSVTVSLSTGQGYTVGSSASATVNVADDDDPPATPWWQPILSAAEPPEHAVSLLTPNGDDALVGWPQKAHYKQYNVRATSFEGHATRWVHGHTGYWWVFEDLEPGTWLFMVYDAKGFPHGGLLFLEVPENGQAGGAIHNVTISAGSGVSEGQGATFTLTASPNPASPLDVTVTIEQSGDYAEAGATGSRTVTIGTSGTATFSVATVDDRVDEADGSVTAWLSGAGGGYVGTGNREAVVAVSDNDVPEVRIYAGTPGMVEGGTAVFVISAGLELASPLTVSLTVGQDGYWTGTGTTGRKTVTIPTSGSVPYRVATVNDDRDEAHGAVIVALNEGDGYTVSTTSPSARASVWDNDAAGTSSCLTSDTALLDSVTSARDAATDSDLVEMLTRSALTMQGRDMYTTIDIKTLKQDDTSWHGSGPDAFWQKVYVELDRLEVCRGPQVVQIIDNTPGKEQSNLAGANVTITANNTTITEGSDAEFTILVTGISLPTTGLFMVLPKDSAGRSSNDMPQYLKLGAGGTVQVTIPAGGLTTLTVPTQDDWTDEESGQIWVGVDKGGPEGFGSWVKMTVTDNDETLPASEAKRIPWMKGYWEEVVTNIDHGKTSMHMRIEWGRPQHYRESQLNWWSQWINYCIEIVGSTRWTGDGELITSKSVGAIGAGPHCRGNQQYPGHQGTDDAYNGGGLTIWTYAKGNTTYTFDIWVMDDKAASKRTFTFTTGDDKFSAGRSGG